MPSRQAASPARPHDLRATLSALLGYMSHARWRLLAVAALVCVSALANLLGTYMIKPVVNAVGEGDAAALARGVGATAAIYAVGVASCAGYSQLMVRVAQKVVLDIRRDLFERIERLPLSFFDRSRHGDVMSYFTNDVDTVSEALNNSFTNLVQAGVQIVGTLVLLVVLDWRLTLVTALACAVCTAWLLPGMHERYFYIAEVLAVAWAVVRPRSAPAAVMLCLSSVYTYANYFWSEGRIPTQFFVFAVLASALWYLRDTWREWRAARS